MRPIDLNSVASYTGRPCITISMNTGLRANKPDYRYTELSRLADQAKFLVQEKADVIEDSGILQKLEALPGETPLEQETGSISIFLSDNVREILYSPWPVPQNHVQVAEHFDLRPLVEAVNNYCEYGLLVLYPKGVRLLHAVNDEITGEAKDNFFPMAPPAVEAAEGNKDKDVQAGLDTLFDRIDKELIARFNKTRVSYVIAASHTDYNNYISKARFMSLYPAHIAFTRGLSQKALATAAWAELLAIKDKHRRQMVAMVGRLAEHGQTVTSLPQIMSAAREGRGDVLVMDKSVQLTDEQEAQYCDIIWHVIRHRGKVLMAEAGELGLPGSIALKLSY